MPDHKEGCPQILAREGAAGIECEHGFDVCPTCDACTCGDSARVAAPRERLRRKVAAEMGYWKGPEGNGQHKGAKHGLLE